MSEDYRNKELVAELKAKAEELATKIRGAISDRSDAPDVVVEHSPIYGSPYSHVFLYLNPPEQFPAIQINWAEEMGGEGEEGFVAGFDKSLEQAESAPDEDQIVNASEEEVIAFIKERI